MSNTLDTNLFYLYLSNSVVAFPTLKKFVDDTYETQKYRFYEKAKSNPYYNHTLMSDRTLEMEVSMKRALVSHNEADISTWLPREYEENLTYGQENCEWSEWVKELKEEIKKDSIEKINFG